MKNGMMLAALAVMGTAGALRSAEVSSAFLRVTLDEAAKGAVTHVVMPDGYDFAVPNSRESLFALKLTRADCYTNTTTVSAVDAKECTAEKTADGVRLVYGEIGKAVEKVVCTVRADAGDSKLRWRIAVTPRNGWKLEETFYPRMMLAPMIDDAATNTVVVGGEAKGGIVRCPASYAKGRTVFFGRQPGNLVAQFVSFYGDRRLFYFGSEDGAGGTKALAIERRKDGLLFNARRAGWDSDGRDFGYDFVTASLVGTAEKPCSWHDAADFYKTWAVKQRWCKAPLKFRDDLPRWIREAPAMVRFYRQNFSDPDGMRSWLHGYWLKEFPKMPLVAAMWGFEHGGTWISDYFPCHPSDETFKSLVADFRANDAHAFPWPSGYHWTLTYNEQPDGTFAYDSRDRFNAVAAPHAVWKRDGTIYDRVPSWLKGGHTATMCGGDEWSRTWWNRDVCLELARRGCEAVQADQIVGGAFPECWATNHPHSPGQGPWKVDAFRTQLETMRETMREAVQDAVVCYEEPCELYNDLIGLQDYRDCNVKGEWAGVFNYIYHEYVPCFQSCIYSRAPRHWYAHMAVDGQIPLFANPRGDDAMSEAVMFFNGDFEQVAAGRRFVGWENHDGTHGVDSEVKHGGNYALRFETPAITNVRQIARNVSCGLENMKPGHKYRLSAWMKAEKATSSTYIHYGLYTSGFTKCRWHGSMRFPKPEEGWMRRESVFEMPNEDSLTLRFMINCGRGENRVWVDDVKFEELASDGSAKEMVASTRGWYHRFMHNWVKMYHGEGRDWLAHGRQVRPPRVWCETVVVEESLKKGGKVSVRRPVVHHAAYESLDGRRALFFANATVKPREIEYELPDGTRCKLTVAPDEIQMVNL